MSDIFISYANQDRERVKPLAEALMGEEWSVFWDRIIPVGKTWPEILEEELESARSLVIVWSQNSIKSKWVREEANEGLRKKLHVFPILLDAVMPPLGFRFIHAADFSKWDGSQLSPLFQSLARDIKSILGPTVTPVPVARKGRLWVETEPNDALVNFLNHRDEFSQGMELEPGTYEIEVSADSYETKRDLVDIDTGEEKHLNIKLTKVKAHLLVKTEPTDTTVKFLNPLGEFTQGMELEPGKYQIEVSADGYEIKREWVELIRGEVKNIVIELTKLQEPIIYHKEIIFCLLWVVTNSIGWFVSWLLFKFLIKYIEGKPGDAEIIGIIYGVIIGFSQWIVLRRQKFNVTPWLLTIWWIGATLAGTITNCRFDIAWPNSPFYSWALWGAVLGIFQVFVLCFILNLKIFLAAWWVLISALGTGIGSLWLGRSPLWPFNNMLVGTVYGAITGFGLIWLLRQRDLPSKN